MVMLAKRGRYKAFLCIQVKKIVYKCKTNNLFNGNEFESS